MRGDFFAGFAVAAFARTLRAELTDGFIFLFAISISHDGALSLFYQIDWFFCRLNDLLSSGTSQKY
jgi:hypothetical protein